MKNLNLLGLVLIASLSISIAQAETIDLKSEGKIGQFCPGNELSYNLTSDNRYVERILISAEGVRKDGFIKVYADGEFIFNVGVPGYDPDYSFRVRRHVNNITLKFEETCSRILDMKMFLSPEYPSNYRKYSRPTAEKTGWGVEFLEISRSLSQDLFYERDFNDYLFPKILMPMKKFAIIEMATSGAREKKSLYSAHVALALADIVIDNKKFLDGLLVKGNFDYVVLDLLRLKEDILERYDVNEKDVKTKIKELEQKLKL